MRQRKLGSRGAGSSDFSHEDEDLARIDKGVPRDRQPVGDMTGERWRSNKPSHRRSREFASLVKPRLLRSAS
jgi:hypothetical protein